MAKDSKLSRVKMALAKNPKLTADSLTKHLGVNKVYAYNLLSKARSELGMLKQRDGSWKLKERMQSNRPEGMTATQEKEIVADVEQAIVQHDAVNHPAHYKVGGVETIDFIEAKGLGYNLGNAVKYISRAEHKGNFREDLLKARWYIERELRKTVK